jgi:hypothetical protein
MVMGIGALDKPRGVWCTHCVEGQGCRIYTKRPSECATFMCTWLMETSLDESWRPDRCNFVLIKTRDGNGIEIRCHHDAPDAWRQEPYYSRITGWAFQARMHGGAVIVCVNRNMTVIAPEGEFPVGEVQETEALAYDFRGSRLVAVNVVPAMAPVA